MAGITGDTGEVARVDGRPAEPGCPRRAGAADQACAFRIHGWRQAVLLLPVSALPVPALPHVCVPRTAPGWYWIHGLATVGSKERRAQKG